MAVALYFIDVLALRAGHEKDEDEADTVGCCTLKVRRSTSHCCSTSMFSLSWLRAGGSSLRGPAEAAAHSRRGSVPISRRLLSAAQLRAALLHALPQMQSDAGT